MRSVAIRVPQLARCRLGYMMKVQCLRLHNIDIYYIYIHKAFKNKVLDNRQKFHYVCIISYIISMIIN